MAAQRPSLRRPGALVTVSMLLVAACGSAPSPVPSVALVPSATPIWSPTPAATVPATPEPSPSPTPAVDAAAGLTIASPYSLQELDAATEQQLRSQFSTLLQSNLATVGLRRITEGQTAVGVLELVRFGPGQVTNATWDQLLSTFEAAVNVKLKSATIGDVQVATGKGINLGYAVIRIPDGVIEVQTQNAAPFDVARALVAGNAKLGTPGTDPAQAAACKSQKAAGNEIHVYSSLPLGGTNTPHTRSSTRASTTRRPPRTATGTARSRPRTPTRPRMTRPRWCTSAPTTRARRSCRSRS
jgi:hypothetical protein